MGYKKMGKSLGFADLAMASSLKYNQSLNLMNKLNGAIDWSRVEQILMTHYSIGTSGERADAYPTPAVVQMHAPSKMVPDQLRSRT